MAPPINVQDWYGDRHTCQIASGALECIRYGRKQSGSSIWTMIRIGLESWSVRPCPDTCRHAKCHRNPRTLFSRPNFANRQTYKHRGQLHLPPPLSEVNCVYADDKQWTVNSCVIYELPGGLHNVWAIAALHLENTNTGRLSRRTNLYTVFELSMKAGRCRWALAKRP